MKTGKTKNRIREGNPAVTVLLYVLVLLICIATVYPMYYVLILLKVSLNTKKIQLLGFMKSMMVELRLVLVISSMKMVSVS